MDGGQLVVATRRDRRTAALRLFEATFCALRCGPTRRDRPAIPCRVGVRGDPPPTDSAPASRRAMSPHKSR